jgi:hypothetical protein
MAGLTKTKRPSSITLISVFGIIGGLLSFYYVFTGGIVGRDVWNTLFLGLIGVVFFICGIGFWLMKKWAVYVYAVFGIINQILLLLMGRWNIMSLLIPALVVYIGYKNLSKMS